MRQDSPFPHFIAIALQRDQRYHPHAYELVRDGLHLAMKQFKAEQKDQHVTGQQVLEGVRAHALAEYGPMALTVLNTWGIHQSMDVGNIVYNLIAAGFFGKSDSDSLDDFQGGLDLQQALSEPWLPKQTRSRP